MLLKSSFSTDATRSLMSGLESSPVALTSLVDESASVATFEFDCFVLAGLILFWT